MRVSAVGMFLICSLCLMLVPSVLGTEAKTQTDVVQWGTLYGSAGFLNTDPHGLMTDAPYSVLVFERKGASRALVLTNYAGDYTTVLEPGEYCLVGVFNQTTAEPMKVSSEQLRCVEIQAAKETHLDISLAAKHSGSASASPTQGK
ncbi:MAG TPA: hypothetical protein VFR24_05320 [Candidatus Angelobacter sp.]|nr:hypothetical protein [Candidatus Angelobacter sp.]